MKKEDVLRIMGTSSCVIFMQHKTVVVLKVS